MTNQIQKADNTQKALTVNDLLKKDSYKKRFQELLNEKAEGFIASVINASKSPSLKDADPNTIISSAAVAASLDLPIDPNLGFSYLVPYNKSEKVNGRWVKTKQAQFQMGYKGFIQLALRSGQYKTINAIEIYEGEITRTNRLTGEIEFQSDISKVSYDEENIVGYAAYFKLTNGFEKVLYMTKEQVEAHARKYSQSYSYDISQEKKSSLWSTSFDIMAKKTVLKLLLSKYGPLTIKMQNAILNDQAVMNDNTSEYVDNQVEEEIKENANAIEVDFSEVDKKEKEQIKMDGLAEDKITSEDVEITKPPF